MKIDQIPLLHILPCILVVSGLHPSELTASSYNTVMLNFLKQKKQSYRNRLNFLSLISQNTHDLAIEKQVSLS